MKATHRSLLKLSSRLAVAFLVLGLAAAAPATSATFRETATNVGDGAAVAFDVFPVRFLTGIQMVLGAAALVPTAALSYPVVAIIDGHDAGKRVVGEAFETFVNGPYQTTFVRPIGE